MPELPEVETVVRDLRAEGLAGVKIVGGTVTWPRTVAPLTPRAFCRRIRGLRIEDVRRRAKYIVVTLNRGLFLLGHLRMTGQLRFEARGTAPAPHDRLVLTLDNGRALHYSDPRKFGRWLLTDDPDSKLGRLGPEPLSRGFTLARLREQLHQRRGTLKPLLLNQRFVAGLGNIYADEALFAAGLHPLRRAESLTAEEQRRLHRAIRTVLRRGVNSMGTTLGTGSTNFYSVAGRRGRHQDQLKVFRRTGLPCPRCRAAIKRIVVGQRSTHFCAACQA